MVAVVGVLRIGFIPFFVYSRKDGGLASWRVIAGDRRRNGCGASFFGMEMRSFFCVFPGHSFVTPHWLSNALRGLAGLLSAGLLAGCCAGERCDCPNQAFADSIVLRFNRDTLRQPAVGFTRVETNRLLLIRRPLDTTLGAATDSVFRTDRPLPTDGGADLVINRQGPFPASSLGVASYAYEVIVLRKPGRPPARRYTLTEVLTESRYVTTTPCCTCFENARKEARLDSGPLLDLYVPPGSPPAVIELNK